MTLEELKHELNIELIDYGHAGQAVEFNVRGKRVAVHNHDYQKVTLPADVVYKLMEVLSS